jgi:LacI family transcriptional regulator
MKYNQVTIKDIARELGISPSTVSRALKDHPDISKETKKAVHELAVKLNYEPNVVALSLRSRKTRTIGVVIPEVVHFFFSTVISGIEHEANLLGYNVILTQSAESLERERASVKALFNSRVDGMLISISRETTEYEHIEAILSRGIPVVFFDRNYPAEGHNLVLVDDYGGARQATEHLISQGGKRIAHIMSAPKLRITQERLRGYKDALKAGNLKYNDDLVAVCEEGSLEAGKMAMAGLLKGKSRPDAVFANNDVVAMGAMQAIREKNLKIPEDVAVVGFSNWFYSQMTDPPLSSVDQPGFEMGKQSLRLLVRQIEHEDEKEALPPETIILKTALVARDSSLRKK